MPTSTRSSPAASSALVVGQPAPDVILVADDGKPVRLSDFRGKTVVLYFYPKDDTPGCTKEACQFRDGLKKLAGRARPGKGKPAPAGVLGGPGRRSGGAVVLGVSADSVESHKRFKEKFRLNFPLLSDPDRRMLAAYGVWKQKSLYGRTFMGIERTTVLIDEAGRIAKVFPRVKVDGHVEEILAELARAR